MGFRRRATRVQHDSTLHSTTMLHAGAPALGNSGPFRHNLSVLPWSWAAKPWLGSSYRMRCGCSRQGCCSGRAGRCRSECSGRRFDHPSANPGRGLGDKNWWIPFIDGWAHKCGASAFDHAATKAVSSGPAATETCRDTSRVFVHQVQ